MKQEVSILPTDRQTDKRRVKRVLRGDNQLQTVQHNDCSRSNFSCTGVNVCSYLFRRGQVISNDACWIRVGNGSGWNQCQWPT